MGRLVNLKFRLVFVFLFCCLFFGSKYYCQSFIDNGVNLFQKNKDENLQLPKSTADFYQSFRNETFNDFEFYSELYMYVLFYEKLEKPKESLKLSNLLFEEVANDNKCLELDLIKLKFKIGLLYEEISSPDSALIQFDYCVSKMKKSFGVKNDLYCTMLSESAHCSSDIYDFNGAKVKYQEILELRRKFLKNDLNKLSRVIHDLALNYHRMGEFKESIKLNEECLSIRIKYFGESNQSYMMTLYNLASDYMSLGNIHFALELQEKCFELRKKYLGENHSHFIMSLNSLGSTYFQLSNYEKSKENFERALKLIENNGDRNSEQYIYTQLNLSDVYDYMDQFGKSLEIRKNCLEINDVIGNRKSFLYTCIINKISDSYYDLGLFSKSEELLLECLNVRSDLFGENHLKYSETLTNLSMLYKKLGNNNLALEFLDKSYEIDRKILGEKHSECYNLISLKAQIFSYMGDFENALILSNKALQGFEKTLGKNSERYAGILNDKGYYLTRLNKLDQAEKFLLGSIRVKKQFYPIENSTYCAEYNNLSTVYLCKKDNAKFFYYQNLALSLKYKEFKNNQLLLTQIQRDSFKKDLSLQIFSALPILFRTPKNGNNFSNDIIENWFNINGINSSLNREVLNKLESKDTLFISHFEEYKNLQSLYNYYCERTKDEINMAGIDMEKLKDDVSQSQLAIYQKLKENSFFQKEINMQSLKNVLNEDEVFLEIIRIPDYDYLNEYWLDSTNYMVIFVSKDLKQFDILKMPLGNEFDKEIFPLYRNSILGEVSLSQSNYNQTLLYNTFWKPIAEKIKNYSTVYVSMNGVYNKINLNTIFNHESLKYLIEEKDIRIVNSARDFIQCKKKDKQLYSSNTAVLFGYPNFISNSSYSKDTIDFIASKRDLNDFYRDSLTRGGFKANPLPETKKEVTNISNTLNSKGWNVSIFLEDNASEDNIKKITSPRVLHIATHGYFFSDIPKSNDNNRFLGMDLNQVMNDPMLRSGLLFAGANNTLKGETIVGENGLLSANEASLLDLRETELVVLSACETGKGEETNSEGVYGLRKAFSDAGAQNIIMSLWKVDDKVTQEFMSRFYEIWLNDKTTIRQAFNRTQLEIKAKYPQPYYWGAFILIGD